MKTLKDHTLLYDATCPMCRLYTRAFVSSGMLDQEGRAPYQEGV
jgi:predicted DCC family thiol-disulfide oxidoreductase YuxK